MDLEDYILLWLIHGLAWFVLSAFVTVLKGRWSAINIIQAFAMGCCSTILHILIIFCYDVGGFQ